MRGLFFFRNTFVFRLIPSLLLAAQWWRARPGHCRHHNKWIELKWNSRECQVASPPLRPSVPPSLQFTRFISDKQGSRSNIQSGPDFQLLCSLNTHLICGKRHACFIFVGSRPRWFGLQSGVLQIQSLQAAQTLTWPVRVLLRVRRRSQITC